ncbi:uncharacterized protein METZ01_LOCUS414082, partial [marine metagenome]
MPVSETSETAANVFRLKPRVCCRYWDLSPCISDFNRKDISRKAH